MHKLSKFYVSGWVFYIRNMLATYVRISIVLNTYSLCTSNDISSCNRSIFNLVLTSHTCTYIQYVPKQEHLLHYCLCSQDIMHVHVTHVRTCLQIRYCMCVLYVCSSNLKKLRRYHCSPYCMRSRIILRGFYIFMYSYYTLCIAENYDCCNYLCISTNF